MHRMQIWVDPMEVHYEDMGGSNGGLHNADMGRSTGVVHNADMGRWVVCTRLGNMTPVVFHYPIHLNIITNTKYYI
jgi:hypothetical protein